MTVNFKESSNPSACRRGDLQPPLLPQLPLYSIIAQCQTAPQENCKLCTKYERLRRIRAEGVAC